MAFEKPVVVIDNGSHIIKAGFSCDNYPVAIFRSVIGRPKYLIGHYGREYYEVFTGDDAEAKIEDLELFSPVKNGRIVHWDNMERIWHYIFYRELKVAPEDQSVLLGCAALTPLSEKAKCCEVFFETLNCPAVCVQPQSVLAIFGSGFTTGISVDLGYDTTDINPVYEGRLVKYAHMQTNLSNHQITDFIKNKLYKRNLEFGLQTNEVIEGIKQSMYITKHISVDQNYMKTYELPSGEKIDISDEAFMAAELLFQPDLVSECKTDFLPLHQGVEIAAEKCDPDIRSDLYAAVIPWGGLSVIPGLNERLKLGIEELTNKPCNVVTSLEPYTVSWLGGATFAGITEAHKIWVTKKQFEDQGEKIVKNKFF